MRSFKIFLLCVSWVSLSACSRSGGRSAGSNNDVPTLVSNLTSGNYSTGCMASGPVSSSTDVVVSEDYLEFTNIMYEDGTCSQPRTKYYYKNAYIDVAASNVHSGARNVNITEGKLIMTAMSASAVNDFNNSWVECGFSDWSLNTAKDVSATSCQETAVGTITYSIAKTANDQLEFGIPDFGDPTIGTTDNLRISNFAPFVLNKQ